MSVDEHRKSWAASSWVVRRVELPEKRWFGDEVCSAAFICNDISLLSSNKKKKSNTQKKKGFQISNNKETKLSIVARAKELQE